MTLWDAFGVGFIVGIVGHVVAVVAVKIANRRKAYDEYRHDERLWEITYENFEGCSQMPGSRARYAGDRVSGRPW